VIFRVLLAQVPTAQMVGWMHGKITKKKEKTKENKSFGF